MRGERLLEPFPFIVGRGRSGTTLVRSILDAHSQLSVVNESYFVAYMASNANRYQGPNGFSLSLYLDDFEKRSKLASWKQDVSDLARILRELQPTSLASAIRRTYGWYASHHAKPKYADKTPVYVMGMDPVAELLPEARFIHVIRDGRDGALSYLEVPWGPATIEEAAFRWKRAVMRGRASGLALGRERYLEVRYEHLIVDPGAVVRTICEFIKLDFEPEMLRYFERGAELTEGMNHPQTRAGLAKPITAGMRDWRRDMSFSQVDRFDAIAGRTLAEVGYERGPRKVGLGVRTRAWTAVAYAVARKKVSERG